MLWWSEPLWISNAEDVYAARYKWYKSILDAAYETYNLTFDYVSANQISMGVFLVKVAASVIIAFFLVLIFVVM